MVSRNGGFWFIDVIKDEDEELYFFTEELSACSGVSS